MTKKEVKRMVDSLKKENFWKMGAYVVDGNTYLYANYHGQGMDEVVYNSSYDDHRDLTEFVKDWFSGEQTKANTISYIHEVVNEMEEKGPGRPPLPHEEKRKARSIKISDKEWAEIQELASKENLSTSEYIRRKALGREV